MNATAALRKAVWTTLVTLVLPVGLALAHGAPALVVMQGTVGPGDKVTLSGDGLGKDGDTVTLVLQGVTYQASLGTVTLKEDGFDNATFVIPRDAPSGTYVIRGKNGQITATAELEITEPTPAAAPVPGTPSPAAAPMAPKAVETVVPQARSPVDRAVSIVLVVLTAGVAVVLLWRNRSDLTRIDR